MRALIQRVTSASVSVGGETIGSIGAGLVIFLGIETADITSDAEWLAGRVTSLRLFPAGEVAWGASVLETGAEILLVSQFTLHASTRKGSKPSWHRASRPEMAIPLYEAAIGALQRALGKPIATGRFGAKMQVALVNDGPVTVLIDSKVRE